MDKDPLKFQGIVNKIYNLEDITISSNPTSGYLQLFPQKQQPIYGPLLYQEIYQECQKHIFPYIYLYLTNAVEETPIYCTGNTLLQVKLSSDNLIEYLKTQPNPLEKLQELIDIFNERSKKWVKWSPLLTMLDFTVSAELVSDHNGKRIVLIGYYITSSGNKHILFEIISIYDF